MFIIYNIHMIINVSELRSNSNRNPVILIFWLKHCVFLTDVSLFLCGCDILGSCLCTDAGLESCYRCAEGYLMENWRCVSSCSQGFYAIQPNSDSTDTQSTCKRCVCYNLLSLQHLSSSLTTSLILCVYVQVWCELSGLCRAG